MKFFDCITIQLGLKLLSLVGVQNKHYIVLIINPSKILKTEIHV